MAILTDTLGRLQQCELHARGRASVSSDKLVLEQRAAEPIVKPWGEYEFLVRQRSDNLMLSEVHRRNRRGEIVQSQNEWILRNGELLYVADRLDANSKQAEGTDHLIVSFASQQYAGEEAARDKDYVAGSINEFGIVLGYLGYFPLAQYIDDSAEVEVTSDGTALVKVDARSDLGHLQLWLDREFGYLPRKLHLVKQGTDLTSERRPVEAVDMGGDDDTWPAGGIDRLVWSAENIGLARAGDACYLQSIDMTHQVFSKAGPIVTVSTHAEVTQAEFDKPLTDKDFLPGLKIPENYPVTLTEANHLPFVWDGERAVPFTHDRATALAKKELSDKRALLVGLNIVVVLALVAFLVFRKSSSRASQVS